MLQQNTETGVGRASRVSAARERVRRLRNPGPWGLPVRSRCTSGQCDLFQRRTPPTRLVLERGTSAADSVRAIYPAASSSWARGGAPLPPARRIDA